MLWYISRCTVQKQCSVSAADGTRTQTMCRHIHEAFWQLLVGFCCFSACHQTFFINFGFSTCAAASRLLLFMGCDFLLTICCSIATCNYIYECDSMLACDRWNPCRTGIGWKLCLATKRNSTSSQKHGSTTYLLNENMLRACRMGASPMCICLLHTHLCRRLACVCYQHLVSRRPWQLA